ncbi:MAG: hypothetical protein AAF985_19655, partial [Bacteroidota bacterium]
MVRTFKLFVLLLCWVTSALSAQNKGDHFPVFEKVELASKMNTPAQHQILTLSDIDLNTYGIHKSTLKQGLLLDLDLESIKAIKAANPQVLELTIPFPKQSSKTLHLVRNNVLTHDFVLRQSSNPNHSVNYAAGLYYTGFVENNPASLVSISIFEDEVIGMIRTAKNNFVIGKLNASNPVKNAPQTNQHLLYKDADLAQPFELNCGMEDDGYVYTHKELNYTLSRDVGDCIRVYFEIDDDIVTDKGGTIGATNYLTGIMNEVITLYANDDMTMAISEILAWDTPAPYSGSSSAAVLASYEANTGAFNGDLSHLVSYQASGGIASGFSGICNPNVDESKCFSSISSSFAPIPNYSYSVM